MRIKIFGFILSLVLCLQYSSMAQVPASLDKSTHKKYRKAKYQGDIDLLVKEIVGNNNSELVKVELIFHWIINHIKYDKEAYKKSRINHNNEDVLNRGKALCVGYSKLFVEMCSKVNIEAAVVDGYSIDLVRTASRGFSAPDHSWNAVKIGGNWKLLDATWATSIVSESLARMAELFLANPEVFIQNHYPSHPMWQLLDSPIQIDKFSKPKQNAIQIANKFNYQDSISKFQKLGFLEKKMYQRKAQMLYNPTHENSKEYYHTLVDWAVSNSEKADSLYEKEEFVEAYELYVMAANSFSEAQNENMKFFDWQIDYAITSHLQAGVILYNQYLDEFDRQESLPHFFKAKQFLNVAKKSFFNLQRQEQINEVINKLQSKGE